MRVIQRKKLKTLFPKKLLTVKKYIPIFEDGKNKRKKIIILVVRTNSGFVKKIFFLKSPPQPLQYIFFFRFFSNKKQPSIFTKRNLNRGKKLREIYTLLLFFNE